MLTNDNRVAQRILKYSQLTTEIQRLWDKPSKIFPLLLELYWNCQKSLKIELFYLSTSNLQKQDCFGSHLYYGHFLGFRTKLELTLSYQHLLSILQKRIYYNNNANKSLLYLKQQRNVLNKRYERNEAERRLNGKTEFRHLCTFA